jgi:16S rRNA (adenine1518-N6/adenine1519-N6)-dimethyltransferase
LPRRLGQHFLIRGSILERIAAAVCPTPEPLVVEIGPGKGALTERLLRRAERVIAVELDGDLVDHLARKFAGDSRLTLLHRDILTVDLAQWGQAAIAGNLPYYITSPILERFARAAPVARRGVFLVQKEVAERLAATPGSRDYGYLTVQMQVVAGVELLFGVPPAAFYPPPKVDSAVVRLTPNGRAAMLGIENAPEFLDFVARCFRHKRKTLRNNLLEIYPRTIVDALPEAALRAEQLPLERFAEIYRILYPVSTGGPV